MKTFLLFVLFSSAAAAFAATKLDKIKLLDGTEMEGTVSGADAQGFNFRTKYGSVRYDWTQLDVKHLSANAPDLYQFMVQKTREFAALDQIATDAQILQFLAGKFAFKTDANKHLKNYGQVLQRLDNTLENKSTASRYKQLGQIATQNRVVLLALTQRYQQLSRVTANNAVQSLLISFRNAMDALLKNDYANFATHFTFARQALGQMGY